MAASCGAQRTREFFLFPLIFKNERQYQGKRIRAITREKREHVAKLKRFSPTNGEISTNYVPREGAEQISHGRNLGFLIGPNHHIINHTMNILDVALLESSLEDGIVA